MRTALLVACVVPLLLLLVTGLPSASASLYANGAGYSLNGALLLPGVSIGGLDVGPTLHRLLAAMRDAELRLDAQQRRIDGLQADNGGLRANLTLAVERVRQLEALNGNTTDIFAGIVRDSMRLDDLQASADALDVTVRGQTTLLTALRGSNTTLFNCVATLLGADAQLATRLASVNSSLALRLSLAEQLSVGSSALVTRVLGLATSDAAQTARLDTLQGSNATLFSSVATLMSADTQLATRLANVNSSLALRLFAAEQLSAGSSPLVSTVLSLRDGLSALQSSNSTLFGHVASLQSAGALLATRITSANDTLSGRAQSLASGLVTLSGSLAAVNSSLALRLVAAEQLTAGSSPLVTRVLGLSTSDAAQTARLDTLQANSSLLIGRIAAAETAMGTLNATMRSQDKDLALAVTQLQVNLSDARSHLHTTTARLSAAELALPRAGSLLATSAAAAPSGWLLCDGALVSRATYAALFAAIGAAYGAGDGSTTFALPDLRGRVLLGAGSEPSLTARALHAKGGGETHTLTVAQLPAHQHSVPSVIMGTSVDTPAESQAGYHYGVMGGSAFNHGIHYAVATLNAGVTEAHTIMQPWSAHNWCIKT